MTLCKMAGYCFVLGDYQGFYAGVDDWQNAAPVSNLVSYKENYLMSYKENNFGLFAHNCV